MLFTSYRFLLFAGILLFLYFVPFQKHQWPVLLIFGYLFVAAADPRYLLFLLFTEITIYLASRMIDRTFLAQSRALEAAGEDLSREEKKAIKAAHKKRRFLWQATGVLVNVAVLVLVRIPATSYLVPLGISFYTLQALGYLIDVGRGTIRAEHNFFKLSLFLSYFPLLVQGPISRYEGLSETLYGPHRFDRDHFFFGLQRVLWGFFKKLVIADRLAPVVAAITADAASARGATVLAGMVLYTFQLYADFTGGIDIVIGFSQMLGIRVQENFDLPLFSTSLKEYWRRWHISMRNWFRDYIFYPLSASRAMRAVTRAVKSRIGERAGRRVPVYLCTLVTWVLTGLWHGFGGNYLMWGVLNWAILMFSEEMEPVYARFHARTGLSKRRGWTAFQILRTFLLCCVLNLFDCFPTAGATFSAIGRAFGFGRGYLPTENILRAAGLGAAEIVVLLLAGALVFSVSLQKVRGGAARAEIARRPTPVRTAVWTALFLAVLIFGAYGIGYDASQFIYNRF